MTLEWSGWTDDPTLDDFMTPYIHWQKEVIFDGLPEKDGLALEPPLPLSKMAAKLSGKTHQRVALPNFARPGPDEANEEDPLIRLTWMPDPDCAIVGVIDSGIALSHARFRRLDGGTRFLSAWLQGGEWRSDRDLPFGRELFRTEIDQLMFRAVSAGAIDEAQFDREAGVTQFFHARGDRRLENNVTHGTFVADLAAGYDLRHSHEDELRRRLPMIAVGLPPNPSMGASGSSLEFFAAQAIEYIIRRADRIWDACDHPKGGAFPIIINLSYGLEAGPKDGHMLIEQLIRAVNEKADKHGRPIRVILPAGNHNLVQGCAKFEFGETRKQSIDWRVQPEDQTPNFVEIWSDVLTGDAPDGQTHPLGVCLAPQSGPASTATPGQDGQINTLNLDGKAVARIYCRRHDSGEGWHRMAYLLCTAPTRKTDRGIAAPAGRWSIDLESEGDTIGFGYVQSDQSLTYNGDTGLLSYFDDPNYQRYDEWGRIIDTASYPDGEITDVTLPTRRRGSLNAIASLAEARVIGSYRASDGKPSDYSSSGTREAVGDGRTEPTCLLPGEEGPATFGLMAAGARSGTAAFMSGTSFSTALATRAVSQAMLDWIDAGRNGEAPGTRAWFEDRVQDDELNAGWPGKTVSEKAGFGRMLAPSTGRVPRRV